ncbi:helix-turn-helix transcriptional regulator [Propionibacteriaceae bacterium Y1923]
MPDPQHKPVQRAVKGRANSLRLVHLLYVLQTARQPLSKAQLLDLVTDYADAGPASRDRMFERDKVVLRELGVDLVVTGEGADERYLLATGDVVLPEVEFSAPERAMLAMAQRVWGEHSVGEQAREALSKLAAAGVELDEEPGRALQPSLTSDPSLHVLMQANNAHQCVRFTYRAANGAVRERDVEPWVLGQRGGGWYLIGFDRTRQESRKFKLARIIGEPEPYGPANAYQVPDDVDPAAMMDEIRPEQGQEHAVVAVRGEYAPAVRRRSTPTTHPDTPEGYLAHDLTYLREQALVQELAPFGADVLVLEPAHLREAMVDHFRRVVAAHGPEPQEQQS